jgi:hypothetical protein
MADDRDPLAVVEHVPDPRLRRRLQLRHRRPVLHHNSEHYAGAPTAPCRRRPRDSARQRPAGSVGVVVIPL